MIVTIAEQWMPDARAAIPMIGLGFVGPKRESAAFHDTTPRCRVSRARKQ